MAEQIGKEGGMAHPGDDLLLAYTRGQLDKERTSSIQGHIEGCGRCLRKCFQYEEDSSKLLVMRNMRLTDPYPSLVDAVMKRAEQWRPSLAHKVSERIYLLWQQGGRTLVRSFPQKIGKTRWRLSGRSHSLPSMAVLLSMLIVLIVVLAISFGTAAGLLHLNTNKQATPKIPPTVTVPPIPTTTPTPTPTRVPSPSPTTEPYIHLCSTPADLAQSRMRVCGDNFTPGHKLVLFYQSFDGMHRAKHQVTVDKQKHFEYVFKLSSCRSVPSSIFVMDYSVSGGRLVTLNDISYENCPTSTSTPQVAGTPTPLPEP